MNCVSRWIAVFVVGIVMPGLAVAQDINGTWHFDYGYDMTFTGSGGSFTGSGAGNGYTWPVTNGVLSGNSVSWHESYDQIAYTVDRIGTINGDFMSGTYTTGGGGIGVPWSATRISGGGSPTPTPVPGGKRPTKLNLFCNRTGVLLETADCAATVADAGPQPVSMPTGTITFEATNGFFPASGSCNPTQTPYSPGIASCKAIFTIPNGFPIGAKFPIDATYSGDATFESSSTSHKLIVASCVGTTAKPCKNSIGLDFDEIPEVIQDAIDTILLCGGTAKTSSSGVVLLKENAAQCVIEATGEIDLAQALVGLTPDQFRGIAAKMTTAQFQRSEALSNYRKLATTLTDEQITKLTDPSRNKANTDIQARNGALFKALTTGTPPKSIFSLKGSKPKKQGNPLVKVGRVRTKIKAGTQREVTFKLSQAAKDLVAIFKEAGFYTLPFKVTVTGTRSDTNKEKTIKGRTTVALN